MKCKIERAKLISIHNRLDPIDRVPTVNDQKVKTIHAHLTLRRHIYQRNRLTIQNASSSVDDQLTFSQKLKDNITIITLDKQPELQKHFQKQKHWFRYSHHNISIQNLSKTKSSRKRNCQQFSSVSSRSNNFIKTQRNHSFNSTKDSKDISFMPIGSAYQNLKNSVSQIQTIASPNDPEIISQRSQAQLNQSPASSTAVPPQKQGSSYYNPKKSFHMKSNFWMNSTLKRPNNLKSSLKSCVSFETEADQSSRPSPW